MVVVVVDVVVVVVVVVSVTVLPKHSDVRSSGTSDTRAPGLKQTIWLELSGL